MKTLLLAAAALLAAATPAAAQVSPFIEGKYGTDKDYGVAVGISNQLNSNLALTGSLGADNFTSTPLYNANIGLDLRLAGPVSTYGSVGYINRDGNDGYRLGAGIGLDLTRNLYLKGGVERDDFGNATSTAAVGRIGFRF